MKLTTVTLAGANGKPVDVLVSLERRQPVLPWSHWAIIRLDSIDDETPGWITHPVIPVGARLLVAMAVYDRYVLSLDSITIADWSRIVRAPKSTVYDAMCRLRQSQLNPKTMVWYRGNPKREERKQ